MSEQPIVRIRLVTEEALPQKVSELPGLSPEYGDFRHGVQVDFTGDLNVARPATSAPVVWVNFPSEPANRQPGDIIRRYVARVPRIPTVNDAAGPSAPSLPRNVVAVAGDASATITWDPPLTGTPLVEYRVRRSGLSTYVRVDPNVTTYLWPSLVNDTSYTFSVVANNTVGSSGLAPSNTVTPAGSSVQQGATLIGASTNDRVNSSRTDTWADLEQRMRTAGGYATQVMSIRHTFNAGRQPVSWSSSPAAADPGLGAKASLLNTGPDTHTWKQISDERDAWVAAGRPNRPASAGTAQTAWDTAYPWQFKKRRFVLSARDTMPAGHFLYLADHHEPGFIQGDGNQISHTGTGRPGWQSPVEWQKMTAYGIEITLRDGGGRVRPTSILQGADFRGYKFPDGSTRTLDYWDYSPWLANAAQKAGTNFAADVYTYHPDPGLRPLMVTLNSWRVAHGFGYTGIAETSIQVITPDGVYLPGEPLLGARHLGDPTYTKGLRNGLETIPGFEFFCVFDSNVITGTTVTATPDYFFSHRWLARALAQTAKGDPFSVVGTPQTF